MVFPPIPVYVDPPNWHQQPNPPTGDGTENTLLPPRPPVPQGGGSGTAALIRPGSMADRARLAKIPQPEEALKCPRCESTNTKFCYFNNYSLSQPRHFCKTCRRYWTRGGALRNVPVGGGCRRNKRSKGSIRSKSPAQLNNKACNSGSNSGLASNSCTTNDVTGHIQLPPSFQLPILPPINNIGEFNSMDSGFNFSGIQPTSCGGGMDFAINSTSLSSGLVEQWRLQQFPNFLANLGSSNGLYSFESEGVETPDFVGQLRSKAVDSAGVATVKMEENNQGLNLLSSRNFLGITGNDQYWGGGNTWTDLSGFTSSSTSHLM